MKKILFAATLVCGTLLSVGCGSKKPTQPQVEVERINTCNCSDRPAMPPKKENNCSCIYCGCKRYPEKCTCDEEKCKENECNCELWKKAKP